MSNGNQTSGQGEFRGDFTRDTFDAAKRFSRVLMQQGRVQLDADWNEQTSIVLHYLRSLAADLIGPHGGPDDGAGFHIDSVTSEDGKLTFHVSAGRYYVDGILCEAEPDGTFVVDATNLKDGSLYFAFLDVWERHVTAIEEPDVAEVALGGPDTATRAQVTHRITLPDLTDRQDELQGKVKALNDATTDAAKTKAETALHDFASEIQSTRMPLSTGMLCARAKVARATEACSISPESQYRGAENQLYRVEIQRDGDAWNGKMDEGDRNKPGGNAETAATFKWSRDNGSVTFPILTLKGDSVKLANLGPDSGRSLKQGDWVEVVDDDLALQAQAGELLQIKDINADDMTVTLSEAVPQTYDETSTTHPLLRRWDQSSSGGELVAGALLLKEGSGEDDSSWIALEDGAEIQFRAPSSNDDPPNKYRAGDYWLIPARVATGDVLWPKVLDDNRQVADRQPPHGVEHHYAPLGIIKVEGDNVNVSLDLRRTFPPLLK